jgi:hypothetical protein
MQADVKRMAKPSAPCRAVEMALAVED